MCHNKHQNIWCSYDSYGSIKHRKGVSTLSKESAGDRATRIHNEAEQDAAKGEYDPPTKNALVFAVEGYSKQELEDIASYKAGYVNGKK